MSRRHKAYVTSAKNHHVVRNKIEARNLVESQSEISTQSSLENIDFVQAYYECLKGVENSDNICLIHFKIEAYINHLGNS